MVPGDVNMFVASKQVAELAHDEGLGGVSLRPLLVKKVRNRIFAIPFVIRYNGTESFERE